MALYLIKPVVWNDLGYEKPSGAKVHSGFPREHGYGHEEWNNSKRLTYRDNGTLMKAFHTEGFGNQPLDEHAGRIFVFMIASHAGHQHIVAVAGNAAALMRQKKRRLEIARKLAVDEEFKEEAWALPRVRARFNNDERRFNRHWKGEVHWIPNWICRAKDYVSLAKPLQIDPHAISGKQSLVKMFGSYQAVSRQTALRLLDRVSEVAPAADGLRKLCTNEADLPDDLIQIEKDGRPAETTRAALIAARLGQGKFRSEILAIWNEQCAVTGSALGEVIRASHIKPWCDCTNRERLDPCNGLPLVAHFDALFDRGLITFDNEGGLLVSDLVPEGERDLFRLTGNLRKAVSTETASYLNWHREHVFRAR